MNFLMFAAPPPSIYRPVPIVAPIIQFKEPRHKQLPYGHRRVKQRCRLMSMVTRVDLPSCKVRL